MALVGALFVLALVRMVRESRKPKVEQLTNELESLPAIAFSTGFFLLLWFPPRDLASAVSERLPESGTALLWALRILGAIGLAVGARRNSSDRAMAVGAGLTGVALLFGVYVAVVVFGSPGSVSTGLFSDLTLMLFALAVAFVLVFRYRFLVLRGAP